MQSEHGNRFMKKEDQTQSSETVVRRLLGQLLPKNVTSTSLEQGTESMSLRSPSEGCSQKATKPMRVSPLQTAWQRKWLDLESTAEIQLMANDVTEWGKRFFDRASIKPRHFMLCGQPGTGKTHTARKIYQWAKRMAIPAWEAGKWPHPPRVVLFEWAKVVFESNENFKDWLFRVDDCDAIFIEDIGAEIDRFKTGEPAERFREVMNEFKDRWLFLTSNVMPEHWASHWDDRIADRLLRNSTVFTLRNTARFTSK